MQIPLVISLRRGREVITPGRERCHARGTAPEEEPRLPRRPAFRVEAGRADRAASGPSPPPPPPTPPPSHVTSRASRRGVLRGSGAQALILHSNQLVVPLLVGCWFRHMLNAILARGPGKGNELEQVEFES